MALTTVLAAFPTAAQVFGLGASVNSPASIIEADAPPRPSSQLGGPDVLNILGALIERGESAQMAAEDEE